MRGDGRIYRDPGSPFWYMAYYVQGKQVRQSTGELDETKAHRALRRRIADVLRGEAIPNEQRVTVSDLGKMLEADYAVNHRRSAKTIQYPWRHVSTYFGEGAKALTVTTDRLDDYIRSRQREGAANASIRIELALLGRAFTLAVRARKLRTKPYIPKPAGDPSRVRQGFFSRDQAEAIAAQLDPVLGDVVRFLFFSAWRVGEVRTLQWKDYDRTEGAIRLRPEHSKNKQPRILPVDTGELATNLARRLAARQLDCPFIFHRKGKPIGDFRKVWATACEAIGVSGRIVHDLRRSGVRHLIHAGVDPHTVMAFSGHRTPSMLKRYHIIALDDLRTAAARGSDHGAVVPMRTRRERAE